MSDVFMSDIEQRRPLPQTTVAVVGHATSELVGGIVRRR